MTIRAKKPITTEGKPASSSMAGLMISRNHVGAKAAEKSAARMAMGAANNIPISVILMVPTTRGTRPYLGLSETGCQAFPVRLLKVALSEPVIVVSPLSDNTES